MSTSTFDALIIGGGPGGATSALLLAKAGWSVALLEKASFPRGKVCGEFLSATNLPLLRHLGVAESFLELAGPDVRQVGLFSGDHVVISAMPRPRTGAGMAAGIGDGTGARIDNGWGRALGRDHLDTLLLQRAAAAGAHIWQPWSVVGLVNQEDGYVCQAVSRESGQSSELRAAPAGIAVCSPWRSKPRRSGSRRASRAAKVASGVSP